MNIFSPPLPPAPGARVSWGGLPTGSEALAIAQAASRYAGTTLVVAADANRAWHLEQAIRFFACDLEQAPPVRSFPDWEVLAYDVFSPDPDITSRRLQALHALRCGHRMLLVTTVSALMQRLPPRAYLDGRMLSLAVGERLHTEQFRQKLIDAGYSKVSNVREQGEFAVRGSLFDFHALGADTAYRVDLLDDEVADIRQFDPESQRTTGRVDAVEMVPAREFPLDSDAIACFRRQWHERFDVDVRRCPVYREVCDGHTPPGIEFYLPLFFTELECLLDYLKPDSLVVTDQDTHLSAEQVQLDIRKRHESLAHDLERPVLPYQALFLEVPKLFQRLKAFAEVRIGGPRNIHVLDTHELPDVRADVGRC